MCACVCISRERERDCQERGRGRRERAAPFDEFLERKRERERNPIDKGKDEETLQRGIVGYERSEVTLR